MRCVGTRNKQQIFVHLNHLGPGRKLDIWNYTDMEKFEEAYKFYGKNYAKISQHIGTKSHEQVQCRVTTLANMYKNNPKSVPKSLHRLVKFERVKFELWAEEEKIKFKEGLIKHGRDWDKIA